MYFEVLWPKLTTVCSSPSPYPSCAAPDSQALSLNVTEVQPVPGELPRSQYFQMAPFWISTVSVVVVRVVHARVTASTARRANRRCLMGCGSCVGLEIEARAEAGPACRVCRRQDPRWLASH